MPDVRTNTHYNASAQSAPLTACLPPTFDQVYATTFALVRHHARRMGVDFKCIDDVVQDVYLAVYRQLDQFTGRCAIQTWVLAILMRVVSNYHRTRRRKGAGYAMSSASSEVDHVADGKDLLDTVEQREAARLLLSLLGRLKPVHAAVFIMSELEGMTSAEIASATDINVHTVCSRLRAARVTVARLLEQFQSRELPRSLATHDAWRGLAEVSVRNEAA